MNKFFRKISFKLGSFRSFGFSLIEVLVGIAITSMVALGLGNITMTWGQLQQRQNLTSTLNQNRVNVQNAVNSDIAWQKTVSLNSATMSCLSSQAGCGGVVNPQAFNLVDASGVPIVSNAYNVNGSVCASNCPIQLVLTWLPQCNLVIDPNCKVPFIKIFGTYTPSAAVKGPLNWDKYNFQLMRQSIDSSPCTGVPLVCLAPLVNACSSTGWTGCIPPGCSPRTLSWTIAGLTCQGPVAATGAGLDSSVTTSTNGNVGSAIFNCNNSGSGVFNPIPIAGATCSTSLLPINGLCGPSNGIAVAIAPVAGLCTTGIVSAVAGAGPWTWSCLGQNGGATDNSCYAPTISSCTLRLPISWDNGVFPVVQCYSLPLARQSISLLNGQSHYEQGFNASPRCGDITIQCVNGLLVTVSKSCNLGFCP